ncbi:hypothetical protein [Candidatus Anaplasma sp. TIGMIC]|uniref:hypothetical protein n=1 Tax=Candidatus Anaplasma sp. TIGMIC TaxID=3020713 RepID=UPI00232DE096|nr:hypothetical protein [Candidatus Anaplasma sp. TIGMIC]MDB1135508.1 hypothetical protein [Candidatus Anaplasma sp. TIGMIC]
MGFHRRNQRSEDYTGADAVGPAGPGTMFCADYGSSLEKSYHERSWVFQRAATELIRSLFRWVRNELVEKITGQKFQCRIPSPSGKLSRCSVLPLPEAFCGMRLRLI